MILHTQTNRKIGRRTVCFILYRQSDLQSQKTKTLAYMEWQKYKQIYQNIKTESLTQREEKKVITAGLTNTERYND